MQNKEEINYSNYQAWFLDYLEHNLSNQDAKLLHAFLLDNSELKEELHEMELLYLEPSSKMVMDKEKLLKISEFEINLNNYPTYFAAYVDGELSDAEKTELNLFLGQNKELINELKLYKKSILSANTLIVFPNKSSLMQHAVGGGSYWWMGLAASIIFLLGFVTLLPFNKAEQVYTPHFSSIEATFIEDNTLQDYSIAALFVIKNATNDKPVLYNKVLKKFTKPKINNNKIALNADTLSAGRIQLKAMQELDIALIELEEINKEIVENNEVFEVVEIETNTKRIVSFPKFLGEKLAKVISPKNNKKEDLGSALLALANTNPNVTAIGPSSEGGFKIKIGNISISR